MHSPLLALLASSVLGVDAQEQIATIDTDVLSNGKYEIKSTGIRAQFVPYGASLSNLFIKDVHGEELDVVMGFDNASYYSTGPWHPHLNSVPGRYANRIRNGTFAIDGKAYHTDLNDNGGLNTLHGGSDGWDYRNWTVSHHSSSSITFTLDDPAGTEGFPGDVAAEVAYFLTPHAWNIRMRAHSLTEKTPIMLTSHTYLNLDGFKNPHTPLAANHSLFMPCAKERIAVDTIGVPTGDILKNAKGSVFDFYSKPKQLGEGIHTSEISGACGYDCSGYDNCFTFRGTEDNRFAANLFSPYSGISLDIFTNQGALQVYSCNRMNGTFPLKSTQGFNDGTPRVVNKYGCVVLEVEDWIDGINHPEWGKEQRQIFGPEDKPYYLEAQYRFSLVHK